jgi:hypothetical protein
VNNLENLNELKFTRKKKLMSLRESGILSALFLHNNTPNLQKAKIFTR